MVSAGYDGRAIANFILDFCDKESRPITNLALQKIVYFCHVWALIKLNRPLIRHKFEAWEYGPVLPYLYREFKKFDRAAIISRATQIDPFNGKSHPVPYEFDSETKELLDQVAAFYTRLNAGHLVDLSHVEGGPWHAVWNHGGVVNPGMKIDDAHIKEFYTKATYPSSMQ